MQQRLGRGLDALISESSAAQASSGAKKNRLINEVEIEKIIPNAYQPRENFDPAKLQELADSIKALGIINPLIVREEGNDRYQLIAGERRLRAAKIAELKTVPVIFQKADNMEMLEIALIENVQRDDLNPIDEAKAYSLLMNDFSLKHEEIAMRVGKSRAAVTNSMRLLKLPHEVKDGLKKNIVSMGHARALLALEDENDILRLFRTVVSEGLSVREVEALIKKIIEGRDETDDGDTKRSRPKVSVEIRQLEEELMELLGTKVSVKDRKNRGKIVIEYYSLDDFERILDKIKNAAS